MIMTFEDLEAWQKARQLVKDVYQLTRAEALGRDFGVCSQLQRSAVSVMSNIAEGFERQHVGEKAQSYNIARGSAGEVRSLLYVIEDNFPGSAAEAKAVRAEVVTVGKLISGLIRATEERRL